MILEKQKEALIQQEGESQESIGMSLDLDSAQILMQMLSKNLYSDDIGSTVRECASNALDSHRRAGTDKPIIVSLGKNEQNNYEFSVEDFGIGLDADDVKNIISKYGKSTKRNSANELGMMGLGFKAPLAYTSTFYFVCRKDGMERKYMMYEGEDVNTIDLLYETSTDQPNGVKVIVPVDYYDHSQFKKKISEQLAYFENVYFNVEGMTNDFTIIRTEHFQFSPLTTDNQIHICLDNVYYPLDYSKLSIDRIYLPIALRFSLTDGIFPTPNREAIRYTQEAKDIILKKLESAANYFIEKYNETVKDTDDFKKVFEYHKSSSRMLKIGKSSWDVHPLSKYATIPMVSPNMPIIKTLSLKRMVENHEYILANYAPKFIASGKSVKDAKHYWGLTRMDKLSKVAYYYESDRIPGIKKDYIRSITDKYAEHTIFKKTPMKLFTRTGDWNCYYKILGLQNHPKDTWRAMIVEYQKLVEGITKDFINIDTLEVPQEFIEARKRAAKSAVVIAGGPKVRRVKLKGEIVCKKAEDLERYVDGKNCKWVSHTYDMAKFHQLQKLFVYGKVSDIELMDKWYPATKKSNVNFITLSERELKVVEKIELHNLIPLSKFMEGKSKAFQKIATGCLIDKFYDVNSYLMSHHVHLKNISMDLFNKIEDVLKYKRENFNNNMSNSVRDVIIEHASEIGMFDPTIIDEFRAIEKIAQKLPFLNVFLSKMNRYGKISSTEDQLMFDALVDLFKYHKHRMDWQNYKIKFNEDVPSEVVTEELTEEII
jgi:hypothetical protein